MILIELNGERQLVESNAGHEGWTVIAEGVAEPPDHAEFIDGAWVVDEAAKAAGDEEARLRAMSRAEFMAEVDAKLAAQAEAHAAEVTLLRAEIAKRGPGV